MANIENFKNAMIGGGARPNQFAVFLQFPDWVDGGTDVGNAAIVLCRGTEIPAAIVENIGVMYRGRQVNFAGERVFQPWRISVYNDNAYKIRKAFEKWSSGIQNFSTTSGLVDYTSYQKDLTVHQLDRNTSSLTGDAKYQLTGLADKFVGSIRSYTFHNAYPTTVGPITLGFEAGNQIETFDIEFHYDYWLPNDMKQGDENRPSVF